MRTSTRVFAISESGASAGRTEGPSMQPPPVDPRQLQGVRRRDLLKASLAAGVTLSAWPLRTAWSAEAGQRKRGGILRVRGYDPPHFDPHLTLNVRTNATLSFAYSTLVRYKV